MRRALPALLPLSLLLLAAGGCGGATSTAVGPAGGEVTLDGVRVVIPEGALAEEVSVGIAVAGSDAPALASARSRSYAFTPHGLTFAKPVTVTIPLTGAPEVGDAFLWAEEGATEWTARTEATIDAAALTGSVAVTSFSFGAVGSTGTAGPAGPAIGGGPGWDPRFGPAGIDWGGGYVNAVAVSGDDVYVAGRFQRAGGLEAGGVARWNKRTRAWSTLGAGFGEATAIAVVGTTVHVASGSKIFRWDPEAGTWSPVGTGLSGTASSLVAHGTDLYAAGNLRSTSGQPLPVQRWDGTTWTPVGTGLPAGVRAIAFQGDVLYAVGAFELGGGHDVARWDGTAWTAVGTGVGGTSSRDHAHAVAVVGSDVYVGGTVGERSGVVWKWDGAAWVQVGGNLENAGSDASVRTLAAVGDTLYAGGQFSTTNGAPLQHLARWDAAGQAWVGLAGGESGTGNEPPVLSLVADGTDLYVGGRFSSLGKDGGKVFVAAIARWDGTEFSALGGGVAHTGFSGDPAVHALAIVDEQLWVGGDMQVAGGRPAAGSARFDGRGWSSLGAGLTGQVKAIASSGSTVFVTGGISVEKNGDLPAGKTFAQRTEAGWSSLGGFSGGCAVTALAIVGTDLYAGGAFQGCPRRDSANIARWSGTGWENLGGGVAFKGLTGAVHALAGGTAELYAGGAFTKPHASQLELNRVGRWDGTAWHALGTGLDGDVHALVLRGTELYVAGEFTTAGGAPAAGVARWDGAAWHALGSGLGGTEPVGHALAFVGDTLYVGGRFTSAGGVDVKNLARWDGAAWSAVGGGVTGVPADVAVYALVSSGTDLFIGGDFSKAGGVPSISVARWGGE